MIPKLNEEEARKRLVCFIDQSKPNKPVVGFGIELGPGLPQRTRLIFYRIGEELNENTVLLLGDNNPFVMIQRISFDDFISDFLRLGHLVRSRYLVGFPDEVELYFRFVEESLAEQCRLRSVSIFEMVDMVNEQIDKRFIKCERFVEEVFSLLL